MKVENNFTKFFLVAILVILCVPIGINYILPMQNDLFKINGNVNQWFEFWSSYSGAVASGLITLWVLYKTLRQNQENYIKQRSHSETLNEQQRKFQIDILMGQGKQKWLDELKQTVLENMDLVDFRHIERLSKRISIIASNTEILQEISQHEKELRNIKLKLSIIYSGKFITKEQESYEKIISGAVTNMEEVLSYFSSYLIKLDRTNSEVKWISDNFEKMEGMQPKDNAALVFGKDRGYRESDKKRDGMLLTLAEKKKNIEVLNELLKFSTLSLITSEEKGIERQLKSYCK